MHVGGMKLGFGPVAVPARIAAPSGEEDETRDEDPDTPVIEGACSL